MQQAAYSRFDGDDAGNRQGTLPIRGTYAAAPRGDDGSSAETVMVGTSGGPAHTGDDKVNGMPTDLLGREYETFPAPKPLSQHGPARIIAICNQKGGVGKTTSSINIAGALSQYGRRCLIVDFDPQGAATVGLGINANAVENTGYTALFDPSIDPDISRQATYGKIAIGSGQLSGQGLTNGTMTQMQIVSENQTDYIFSVAGEELGFIGCMLIIGLLTLLILRLFYVSYRASTTFSSLLAVGVSGMFLFQTFMNIFMNVGLLPVMGLTLPFFSYGGTSIVTMYAALGIAAGVRMREKPSWLQ